MGQWRLAMKRVNTSTTKMPIAGNIKWDLFIGLVIGKIHNLSSALAGE
jgi:hypothetical protein